MTENKDKHTEKEKDKQQSTNNDKIVDKEHVKDKEQHDRTKKITQLMDLLSVPGPSKMILAQRHGGGGGCTSQRQPGISATSSTISISDESSPIYRSAHGSFQSEVLMMDVDSGDIIERLFGRSYSKDDFGTQRVYKKTSPNCVLTLYLPTREITLCGNSSSVLRGIVYVDPKAIQGYRVYAQLTLTFRYGREDEEVMGLRFCNEAIMSLHQVWPRNEEPARENLSPLQEALGKRLGDGAHPFTLTLSSQAPPSVQLVPAKRYYGAPIGTSYDVRCFIADKTDEKFHRRASVKMGVRVIYSTDVFHHNSNGPENFAALINNQMGSPPATAASPPVNILPKDVTTPPITAASGGADSDGSNATSTATPTAVTTCHKTRKSERGDSFSKLRLSPKSFRFSGRFGRSKSEIEKCPNDPVNNYSKSFQEYDSSCGGPQGAVDKPFLLQDGRVGLRASLDKAWYTHGEDVCVTVNIRNDSRKTVRKVRVCAIQHVDVCMFNNGKFKNIVADSDGNSPVDRTVPPGATLNATIVLKPQRGPTKNWIALEDTLQRSTEPDEITGAIAASAIRSPNFVIPSHGQSASHSNASPAVGIPQPPIYFPSCSSNDDRNVFAIYVSYYVKVKLTLSGIGGELSLKLPFVLVHIDETQRPTAATLPGDVNNKKLALDDVPSGRKNGNKTNKKPTDGIVEERTANQSTQAEGDARKISLDCIETFEDELHILVPTQRRGSTKPRLVRSETLAKDLDEDAAEQNKCQKERLDSSDSVEGKHDNTTSSSIELEHVHVVQVHTHIPSNDCHDNNDSEVAEGERNDAEKSIENLDEIVTENISELSQTAAQQQPHSAGVAQEDPIPTTHSA